MFRLLQYSSFTIKGAVNTQKTVHEMKCVQVLGTHSNSSNIKSIIFNTGNLLFTSRYSNHSPQEDGIHSFKHHNVAQ